MLLSLIMVATGLTLLAIAADQFVVGAARVALIRRLSPLVVGITIIGFGTSLPELLVSYLAASQGRPEIALANITGSNIANLSLLLGIGAVILPITITSAALRREAPLTLAAMAAFAVAAHGGISKWEGLALLVALAPVFWITSRSSGASADPLGVEVEEFADPSHHQLPIEAIRTALGLLGTVAGAQLLLSGAVDAAARANVPDALIGATVVALGTSLPELVTVIQSARRGETDLIVGNLLGSNLFNSLAVGGAVGLTNATADTMINSASIALAVAAVAGCAMYTQQRVARWEGVGLVTVYGAALLLFA